MLKRIFDWALALLFCIIALILFVLAFSMVLTAGSQLVQGAFLGEIGVFNLMNSVGLIIVSLAIVDLGKFIIEENVMRERELRSPREAMFSLTKFMSIIIIATSLEGIVGIFEVGREKEFSELIYPSIVMITAVIAMVGLGTFQLISGRAHYERVQRAGDESSNEDS